MSSMSPYTHTHTHTHASLSWHSDIVIYPLELCVINKLIFDCLVWVFPLWHPFCPPSCLPVSDYLCLFCSSFVFFCPSLVYSFLCMPSLPSLFLLLTLHFHVCVGVTLTGAVYRLPRCFCFFFLLFFSSLWLLFALQIYVAWFTVRMCNVQWMRRHGKSWS